MRLDRQVGFHFRVRFEFFSQSPSIPKFSSPIRTRFQLPFLGGTLSLTFFFFSFSSCVIRNVQSFFRGHVANTCPSRFWSLIVSPLLTKKEKEPFWKVRFFGKVRRVQKESNFLWGGGGSQTSFWKAKNKIFVFSPISNLKKKTPSIFRFPKEKVTWSMDHYLFDPVYFEIAHLWLRTMGTWVWIRSIPNVGLSTIWRSKHAHPNTMAPDFHQIHIHLAYFIFLSLLPPPLSIVCWDFFPCGLDSAWF